MTAIEFQKASPIIDKIRRLENIKKHLSTTVNISDLGFIINLIEGWEGVKINSMVNDLTCQIDVLIAQGNAELNLI